MMNKLMVVALTAVFTAFVSAEAAESAKSEQAPVAAGKKECGSKGSGWGKWKQNPDNIKKFDKNGDGIIGEDEKDAAKAAWKKETGRDSEGSCDGEKKKGGCSEGKGKEGCSSEK